MYYVLNSSVYSYRISRHKTLRAAILARIKHSKRMRLRNPNGYITYFITDYDGNVINQTEIDLVEINL
jgi:hypothetical protein